MDFPPLRRPTLFKHARRGDAVSVRAWLRDHTDVDPGQAFHAAWAATRRGHLECLDALFPFLGPLEDAHFFVLCDAAQGHADGLAFWLQRAPVGGRRAALERAAGLGYTACVSALLAIDPALAKISKALETAARHGHEACVDLLIPGARAQPQALTMALVAAAFHGRQACVDRLLPMGHGRAWSVLLRRTENSKGKRRWQSGQAMEMLADAASPALWREALDRLPEEIIPGIAARWHCVALAQALAQTTPDAPHSRRRARM